MRRGREQDAWEDARHVAARALAGYVLRDIGSATHFHTADVAPQWGPRMLRVAQVGLHVFYRFNPHADDAPAAAPPQQAVYTALPAEQNPPTLRLAAAILQKPDAAPSAPSAAPVAAKDIKAVTKAPEAAEPALKPTEAAAS
jgi:hypothetical protein